MRNLWTFGGLPLLELLRRTIRESWEDSVFGQAALMAFYHFVALFPALLVALAIGSHVPHLGDYTKNALDDLSQQVFPDRVAQLFHTVMGELNGAALNGFHFVSALAGASWAAFNGTWAMVHGLNRAYEVQEGRSRWKLWATFISLTLCLALLCCLALALVFCGTYFGTHVTGGAVAIHAVEWTVLIAAVSLWFAVLYRFAPSTRDREWRWSTPGAGCALVLWIGAALGARIYFDRINDYSRTYGHLNGVVMLLLWLYISNGAILIGGEMNSEIEKAAEHRLHAEPVTAKLR